MIFTTWDYLLFLLPSAALFRLAAPGARPWIVTASGVCFFVYFSYTVEAGALGAAFVLIFLWEAAVSRLYKPGSVFCALGIVQAVLFLMAFKYWRVTPFLPLGISFFTFEFIHYAVDRYRDRTQAGGVGEYMAFIMFFPTMVAGPIKRYQDFLPKLRSPEIDWTLDWQRGTTRILAGLAKKLAIADLLTAYTIHLNVHDIAVAHRGILPVWLLAYGIKIYVDFSAYSDIAIGSARLFGIRVPENFDWPYTSTNITDFWRRWHISLSSWLLDYVFIPLGGSRVPMPRVYVNVLVTMAVSGVWHGVGVNYVVWGLLHGVMLAVHRWWSRRRHAAAPRYAAAMSWILTFVCVNLAWAFFAMDIQTAVFFFRRMVGG